MGIISWSFLEKKRTSFFNMKLFNLFVATTVALNLPEGISEEKDEANSILSRVKRRRGGSRGGSSYRGSSYSKPSSGISGKTVGKIAAGAGAVYVGGKLASGIGRGMTGGGYEEFEGYRGGGGYYGNGGMYNQGGGMYGQGAYMSEENRQEMEEIREEPEEEREGPFNIFGMFG